jgi:hypothetical protein
VSAFDLPLPPADERDPDGRWVHPYVRQPSVDRSAHAYTTARDELVDEETRSRESRLAFHAIEGLLGHLTPTGYMTLMQSVMHRLYTPAIADEIAKMGMTPDELDPRGELLPFEALFSERLRLILGHVEEILIRCPECGRRYASHEEKHE